MSQCGDCDDDAAASLPTEIAALRSQPELAAGMAAFKLQGPIECANPLAPLPSQLLTTRDLPQGGSRVVLLVGLPAQGATHSTLRRRPHRRVWRRLEDW